MPYMKHSEMVIYNDFFEFFPNAYREIKCDIWNLENILYLLINRIRDMLVTSLF
jgi:hypothetical protein